MSQEPEQLQEAGSDDLGPDRDWEWVDLPRLGKRVRVRYAATHEISYLSLLPDMLEFAALARRAQELRIARERGEEIPEGDEDDEDDDPARYTAENVRWRQRLAHVVVQAADEAEPSACQDCGLLHPPSLWTSRRTSRLHGDDLGAIVDQALDPRLVEAVRPLSTGPTREGSPEPADTTESTPLTSSV